MIMPNSSNTDTDNFNLSEHQGHPTAPPSSRAFEADDLDATVSDVNFNRNVFNALPEAVVIAGVDAVILRANSAAAKLTNYTEDELVGRSITDLAVNRRLFSRLFNKAIVNGNGTERVDTKLVDKNGRQVPISVSATKIFDDSENVERVILVARDIARRKRLETESHVISQIIRGVSSTANLDELLRLIHKSIRRVLSAENFFVALLNPETDVLTMQFFVDKYDTTPPTSKIGRSFSAYVFRTGKPLLVDRARTKEMTARGDVETVGTASAIWLGIPLKTPKGPIGVLVVQDYENEDTYTENDVDFLTSVADQIAIAIERKQAEDALRRSKERFELVTRATSDAIWDWNMVTDELWWNEGFQKLFGYPAALVGSDAESWKRRIHHDDHDRVLSDLKRHVDSGNSNWSDEYRFRRHDGSFAFVIDRGYVVRDDNGKPVRMLGSMMDVTERKLLEEQLTHQALHDPLTKIANRVLFRDRVDHALSKLRREDTALAVLFLDLDNFKSVNDSIGHAAGDKLLIAVAQRLQDCLRSSDTAARLGGDEFAVLVESVRNSEESIMIAERISTVFRQPFIIEGKEVYMLTSIGIAQSSPEAATADDLLRNADLAMYRAKNSGKGRYVVFEPRMHQALVERLELEDDLRAAIENREFTIHYQPIVDLRSTDMLGMEALVRWNHPRYGLLAPMKFIPLAEETNLIVPLGEWILGEACRQAQEWCERYCGSLDITLTVNISIRQFQQKELVDIVRRALEASGLKPGSLILEITESFMMQETESTVAKLHELKKLGIRLAIDDFGTGYSSLNYLQRFPIDILKIDKSFIDKLGHGKEGRAVAQAIIMMGDSLNLKTIAEGIERPEQIDALQNLGCEAGQGFHFARPLTAEAMESFLAEKASVHVEA
jgi:diguanylate cyclase (GGDEF)-like protein/PAS domain S-box-containing protein